MKREYYNSQYKLWYLETLSSTHSTNYIKNTERMLSNTREFEERLEKDVCNWNVPEIFSYYKYLQSSSVSSLSVLNSTLSGYVTFMISQGLVSDHQNRFKEINYVSLEQCVNQKIKEKKVITRDEILDMCKMALNSSDAFVALAMFEGLDEKSIYNLRIDEVDFNDSTVTNWDGKVFNVSSELLGYIKDSWSEVQYVYINDETGEQKIYDDLDGNEPNSVFKFKRKSDMYNDMDDIIRYRRVNSRLLNFKKVVNNSLINQNSLIRSGKVHRVKELCKKYNEEPLSILKKHADELCEMYNVESIRFFLGGMSANGFVKRYEEYLEN